MYYISFLLQKESFEMVVYGINWEDFDGDVKKEFLFLLMNWQRKLLMRVGNMFTLSFELFTQVINY